MTASLHILVGPMRCDSFAYGRHSGLGKTSGLVAVAEACIEQHGPDSVVALQPATNTRDNGALVCASGKRIPAQLLRDPMEVWHAIEAVGLKLLIVDEMHLWIGQEHSLLRLILKAQRYGLDVWCAGIEIDHLGHYFNWWPLFKNFATEIHQLTAPCQCGRRATKTFRHGLSNSSIHVSELGHYEANCGTCGRINRLARWLRGVFRKRTNHDHP